jgi:hypothetical protein
MTTTTLSTLCLDIHSSNRAAGWWTDLKTGGSILATRNRPEMLMLSVSELAEAAEGIPGGNDDKLTHLPMFDVELGDFVIRQLDQIGAEVTLGAAMPVFREVLSDGDEWFRGVLREVFLLTVVRDVADAMEHYRKGRVQDYVESMRDAVMMVVQFARVNGIDLLDIIVQKRAYNATRADHQVENRKAEGGKAF